MQYKSIVLELLKEEFPSLHEQLRMSRTLLASLDRYALGFKTSHEALMEQLSRTRPGSGQIQIASAALELALEDLKAALRADSPPDEGTDEPDSLDAAMAYLWRHTPRA
jgi:hypothetical protein